MIVLESLNRIQPLSLLARSGQHLVRVVGVAADNKGTGLQKASSWRWIVSGAVVLGVPARQHFTCP
jgi:hypothetical protein